MCFQEWRKFDLIPLRCTHQQFASIALESRGISESMRSDVTLRLLCRFSAALATDYKSEYDKKSRRPEHRRAGG